MKECNANLIIEKLKVRKNELGWTNKQLSEKSGVSEGTLNKILGTETKDPSISNILKMIAALGLAQSYVFDCEKPVETLKPQLSLKEQHLLDLFRQLSPTEQGTIIGRAELLVEQHQEAEAQAESS